MPPTSEAPVTHHLTMPKPLSGFTLLFLPRTPSPTSPSGIHPAIAAPIWPTTSPIPFFHARGACTRAQRSHMDHANSLFNKDPSSPNDYPLWYRKIWPHLPPRPLTLDDYQIVPCTWTCTQTANPSRPTTPLPRHKRTTPR